MTWHCNPLCAGIFHVVTARPYSNTSNCCLKRGVSLWTTVGCVTYCWHWCGCEGMGGVCVYLKKKKLTLPRTSLWMQLSWWLTALSMTRYLTPRVNIREGVRGRVRLNDTPWIWTLTSAQAGPWGHMTSCIFCRRPSGCMLPADQLTTSPNSKHKWVMNNPLT